ncbi:MAG: aminopeptidase [Steroidobacteraceae bacterium]|jgi:hypothetical protein|nr:aminopeptidase [Steroidobacteraceae bacterium]
MRKRIPRAFRRPLAALAVVALLQAPAGAPPAWAQAAGQPALPQRTMQWQALAARIVAQLQLEPGERVIAVAQPGVFTELVPHLRYEVMKAGGVDLGVLEVLDDPYPEAWDAGLLGRGFIAATAANASLLRDVDAAIMLPGANPVHPAYAAMQRLLREAAGPRRTIHFHWTDPYSSSGNESGLTGINVLPGFPPPPLQVVDRVYQRAVLETDLAALAAHQARFVAALRGALVRVTTPAGTDLRFRIGDRDVIEQNGDASARRMRAGAPFLVREVEIPAGAVRVAPLEDSVEGVVVYPFSAWAGQPVEDARLTLRAGTIVRVEARRGREHLEHELAAAPAEARRFREFGLGFNPLLAPAATPGWIGYYGYGAGVVRLGLGNNAELGGSVRGRWFRWRDLLTDATVTLDGEPWLQDGRFVR